MFKTRRSYGRLPLLKLKRCGHLSGDPMAVSPRPRAGLLVVLFVLALSSQVLCAPVPQPAAAVPEQFPAYPEIKPNIDFWIDIFTRYSKRQGVVHHIRDLSKVYAVIPLDPSRTQAAAKKNRQTIKQAVATWKTALLKASKGTLTDPEKKEK